MKQSKRGWVLFVFLLFTLEFLTGAFMLVRSLKMFAVFQIIILPLALTGTIVFIITMNFAETSSKKKKFPYKTLIVVCFALWLIFTILLELEFYYFLPSLFNLTGYFGSGWMKLYVESLVLYTPFISLIAVAILGFITPLIFSKIRKNIKLRKKILKVFLLFDIILIIGLILSFVIIRMNS